MDAGPTADPLFSHMPRFLLTSRIKDFYSAEFRAGIASADPLGELRASIPTRFFGWSPLNQAAFLEMTTLLSPYLLASQGDRVAMASAVEARYPFLDIDVVELACALPADFKLRVLDEKHVLKRAAAGLVPDAIVRRAKQPYRAPDALAFVTGEGTVSACRRVNGHASATLSHGGTDRAPAPRQSARPSAALPDPRTPVFQ